MTVVGTAEIRFKGVDEITPMIKQMGQTTTKEVGEKSEKAAGRFRSAMKSMTGSLTAAMGPAFQPIQEVLDKMEGIGEAASQMRSKVGKSLLGIGGAATATGTLLTTMGDKDKIAIKQLQSVVENAGGSWEKYKDETEKTIKSQEKYGHTAVDTTGALNTLVTRTGKVEESYKQMQLVTDLAANRHMSLASAAGVVARVMNGNTRVLRQYGISQADINKITDTGAKKAKEDAMAKLLQQDATNKSAVTALKERDAQIQSTLAMTTNKAERAKLKEELVKDRLERTKLTGAIQTNKQKEIELKAEIKNSTSATKSGAAATDLLAKKLSGQANIAADTFTGKMKEARAKVEDFIASAGQKIGPALQVAGPALMGFGAIIESGIVGKLGKGLKAMKEFDAFQKIAQATTKIGTGINIAFGLSEDAMLGPIILIVAGIALLVAGVVIAYIKFKPFHELVNTIARDLKTFFLDALHAVTHAFTIFVHFFEGVWKTVFDILKKYLPIILSVLVPFIGIPLLIIQHWNQIVPFMQKLWQGVTSWVSRMAGDVISFISGMVSRAVSFIVNLVTTATNWMASLPGRIANGLASLGSAVYNAISRGLSNARGWILGFFSGAGGWLSNIGGQIMQGLANGISNMAGLVGDAVRGIINSIPSAVRKIMHLLSPSKVMHNMGEMIIQGMVNGMTGKTPAVSNAASNVARAAIPVFGTVAGPGVGGQVGGARIINLFPDATIDFGKEDPAQIVQRLQNALMASRL